MSSFSKLATSESKYKLLSSLMKKHRQFASHILSLHHDAHDGLDQWDKKHQTIGLVSSKEALASAKEAHP
jgi:hypothetical protein